MTTLGNEDLTRLLHEGESDRVEFKESLSGDAPTKIREAICAFANDLPYHRQPGVVFVGVRDDGTVSGLPITDEQLTQLADMKTDGNIVPPPSMTVVEMALPVDGKRRRSGHGTAVGLPTGPLQRQSAGSDRPTARDRDRARRTNPQRKAPVW